MMKSFPRPIVSAMLVSAILHLLPIVSFAQWVGDGLEFNPGHTTSEMVLLPDDNGGVWVAWQSDAIRVQRYDGDGYPWFPVGGIEVFQGVPYPHGYLLGAALDSDGNVLVGVINGTMEPDFLVYGQKIAPEGDLLWGDEGYLAAHDIEPYPLFSAPPRFLVSDEQGGIWIMWTNAGGTSMYLNGVSFDGEIKRQEDLYCGPRLFFVIRPYILSDKAGGAYAVLADEDGHNILAHHILPDGSLQYEEPRAVLAAPDWWPDYLHFSAPLYVKNDLQNGLFVCTKKAWQHVTFDLDTLWINEGIPPGYIYGEYYSDIVVLEDNSVAQSTNFFDNYTVMARLDSNGVSVFPEGYDTLGTPCGTMEEVSFGFIQTTDRNSIYCLRTVRFGNGPGNPRNIHVQRVDLLGNDLWPDRDVLLFPPDYTSDDFNPGTNDVTVTTDDNLIFAIKNNNNFHAYLFCISPEGDIAGQNSVGDTGTNATHPETFIILNTYPNPFNREVVITLDVSVPGEYEVTFINITGQSAGSQILKLSPGKQLFRWRPGETLATGIYFARFSQQNHPLKTCKLVYLK